MCSSTRSTSFVGCSARSLSAVKCWRHATPAFAADGLNDPQLALMWTESNILIDVECLGQQLLRLRDRHGNCM